MEYEKYTSKDFILDDDFKNWVVAPNAENEAFWKAWLVLHPERQAEVAEAREFILRMQFKTYAPSQEEFTQDWQTLSRRIELAEQSQSNSDGGFSVSEDTISTRPLWQNWLRIAASLVFLIAAGVGGYFLYSRATTVVAHTHYGEIKNIVLADETVVTLNANSRLTYRSGWNLADSREVWLEGEAFFEVKKKADKQKFIVHAQAVNVEVLGTRFNVHDRNQQVQVVLNEGKVKLNTLHTHVDSSVVMQVGEWVEFSETSKQFRKKTVNPEVYSSWKNKEWMLDNVTIQEVAQKIEETYGIQVEIQDKRIAAQTVSGVVPTDNLNVLLKALITAFDIKITQKTPKQILITP